MIRDHAPGGAEMTSQQQPDIHVRGKPAGAAAVHRQDNDTLAKSYRYLRMAMVGLLLCLAAAVLYQSWIQGNLLGSVSAYYFTPAQAIFVGGLIGLGACMIALKGTTPVEDVFLNLGGVFAAVVAIVPTARSADYRDLVRECREAGTPLLTEKASTGNLDCPTVQALADATKANVENNLSALLVVGAIALLASLVFAWRDGTLKRQADGHAVRNFWLGFGVAVVLWLAALIARLASLQWLVDNAHFLATWGLALCVLVVVFANARRVEEREQSGDVSRGRQPPVRQSPVSQSLDAVGELIAVRRHHDWYIWIARLMLLVTAVTLALWFAHRITLFWVEGAVAVFFIAFWTVQTFEVESHQGPGDAPRGDPQGSQARRARLA
jgi:hypothetical protein